MSTDDRRVLSEETVRSMVKARDLGRCQRCGKAGATNLHHRINGGMGGSRTERVHGVAGRVTLCGSGTTGCHGWATALSTEVYRLGWAIRRNGTEMPSEVPLYRLNGSMFFLTDEGTVV